MPRRLVAVSLSACLAACQGDPAPPPPTVAAALLAPEEGVLRLMGTGAMEPLARELALAWRQGGRAPLVVVEPSVGSGGGVRAVAEGAVDLGAVSRALLPDEQRLGLVEVPVARDAVVIAANQHSAYTQLTSAQLIALYAGRGADDAVLLLRDAKESANDALERVLPALTPLRLEAYRSGRLRVVYHDDAMSEALATTSGALGVFDHGAVVTWQLPLRLLPLDGVAPSVETLADGRWRATRELALVVRPERLARVQPFLDFVASEDGRRLTRRCGYLPAGVPVGGAGTPPQSRAP